VQGCSATVECSREPKCISSFPNTRQQLPIAQPTPPVPHVTSFSRLKGEADIWICGRWTTWWSGFKASGTHSTKKASESTRWANAQQLFTPSTCVGYPALFVALCSLVGEIRMSNLKQCEVCCSSGPSDWSASLPALSWFRWTACFCFT